MVAMNGAARDVDTTLNLQGRTAIVTGGASGFGRAIARKFASAGANVVVADIDVEGAQETASSIRKAAGSAIACQVDVSDGESMSALIAATQATYAGLDIFVNNAGVGGAYRKVEEVEERDFDKLFNVNVKSLYWCTVKATGALRASRRGVIINIASTSAIRPRAGIVWYSASKGAVNMATKALALELAPDNIRVCSICPVAADTPMMSAALTAYKTEADKKKALAAFAAGIPLGRLCTPEDVANAALFLSSDAAAFITGVSLEVDGGRCV